MQLILPSVSLYQQEPGIQGMYKAIAKAGHVCYASEKEGDGEEFTKRCVKLGHMRPLEFGTVYLKFPYNSDLVHFYSNNEYSKMHQYGITCYVTTNYRVLVENNCVEDLHYWCEPTEFHDIRHHILWEHIGRDTADEFRTHIKLSSLMQSTRYCAYDKEKFGGELKCIIPCDWIGQDEHYEGDKQELINAFNDAEKHYIRLRTIFNWPAEKARKCLPLDIATVFIQCGFEEDWDNFFNQRVLGTTGTPHPDAKYIAEMIYESYKTAKQGN